MSSSDKDLVYCGDVDIGDITHLKQRMLEVVHHDRARQVQMASLVGLVAGLSYAIPFEDGLFPHRRNESGSHPRGAFPNGDPHPDMCSCSLCAKWRKARRSPSNRSGR